MSASRKQANEQNNQRRRHLEDHQILNGSQLSTTHYQYYVWGFSLLFRFFDDFPNPDILRWGWLYVSADTPSPLPPYS